MPCIRVTEGKAHEPAPIADGSIFVTSAHFLAHNISFWQMTEDNFSNNTTELQHPRQQEQNCLHDP